MDTKQLWERQAQSLIRALGHDRLPTAPAATCYQLLMRPAFHPACCFTLAFDADAGELCVSILLESHIDAIARDEGDGSGRRPEPACLEEIVALDRAAIDELREQLAACEPGLLDDRLLASRDGIYVHCRYSDPQITRAIHMSSPSAAEAPQHLRLIETLLTATRRHIDDPAIHGYLATLERYFQ